MVTNSTNQFCNEIYLCMGNLYRKIFLWVVQFKASVPKQVFPEVSMFQLEGDVYKYEMDSTSSEYDSVFRRESTWLL